MNNNYYQPPMYPGKPMASGTPNQQTAPTSESIISLEQSYIENILRMNTGKVATFHMSYPDSVEWRDKAFTGVVEEAGRDHIIISDPKTGIWHLLLSIYLNYVEFHEKINYKSPINYNHG